MIMNIVAVEIDCESKLEKELREIQELYELDMQKIADQLEVLNVKHQKRIKQIYIKFNIPLPKKHKPPDMS